MKAHPRDVDTPPSGAGHVRLFVALWPPSALAAALHARGAQACADAPARREPPGRLHLTLHFLGSVPRARLPALQAALCLPFSPFELRFGACTRWPSGVVVAEPLSQPARLLALHAALAQALAALGLRTETRAFRPHVTLARRHAGPARVTPAAAAPLRWCVRRYGLVESLPGPPPRYALLASCSAQPAAKMRGHAQPRCQAAVGGVGLQLQGQGKDEARERDGKPRSA